MYLIDTDVLSHLRRRRRDPQVEAWIGAAKPATLFLSVVSVGEIENGITRKRCSDPEFAAILETWLIGIVTRYGDRLLPVTLPIARRWGQLSGALGHRGSDLLIAATAIEHGLTVVTRNVTDFAPTGALVLNPFSGDAGGLSEIQGVPDTGAG